MVLVLVQLILMLLLLLMLLLVHRRRGVHHRTRTWVVSGVVLVQGRSAC